MLSELLQPSMFWTIDSKNPLPRFRFVILNDGDPTVADFCDIVTF